MRKITLTFLMLVFAVFSWQANAQTSGSIFEDFNSGVPAGWSTQIVTGNCDWYLGDLPWAATGWEFPTDAFYFDDDACGSSEPASNAILYSDVYDMTGNVVVFAEMSFDAMFRKAFSDDRLTVEVFDGSTWVQIANYTVSRNVANSATGTIDVAAHANPDFQVRFSYIESSGWNWGAGIDNFALDFEMADVVGTPPQIVCPLDITVNTSDYPQDDCGAQVFFADAQAFDAEDGLIPVTQTDGPGSGSIFPVGETVIEFSATDSDGNTSTCQFTVTVLDDVDPVAACQEYTIELDENGIATLEAAMLNEGYGFSCTYSIGLYDTWGDGWNGGSLNVLVDGVVVLEDITLASGAGPEWFNFDVMPGQSIDVEYTSGSFAGENWFEVSDGADGAGTVIYDTPSGSIPAASHSVDNLCVSGDGSSDLCGGVFFSFDEDGLVTSIDLECLELGENMITLYITDDGGNQVTCEVLVTVEDNIAPEIVCLGGGTPGFTAISCPGTPGPTSAADTNLVSLSLAGESGSEINFSNSCPGVTGLQNQTASSVDLLPGETYTVNATSWTCGASQYTAQTYVWIDFNGDGILETPGEVVLTGEQEFVSGGGPTGASPTGGNPFSDTFTVPASAYQGPVAIRVMTQETSTTPLDPCASYSWGSMVDFTANVLDPNPGSAPQYFLDVNGEVEIPITDLYDSVSDNAEDCGITVSVGGGAANPCSQAVASNNLENGLFFGGATNQFLAVDVDVAADETFSVNSMTINVAGESTFFDVIFYEDAAGLPGTEIETFSAVNIVDNVLIGNNFGFDFFQYTLDGFNIDLEGDAAGTKYWMEVRTDAEAWESTSASALGELGAFNNDNTAGAWQLGLTDEYVYELMGTCGGGSAGNTAIFTCADLGMTEIVITATDAAGNTSSCTSTIEIIDNIAPVLVTQDITVELDENGEATIEPEDVFGVIPSTYNVITISSDNGSGDEGFTDLVVDVTADETVSFDWSFTTQDGAAFDSFGYIIDGVYTQLSDPAGGLNQTGNATVPLVTGQEFGFRSQSDDGTFGPATTTVSNFEPGFNGQFAPANWTEVLTNSDGSAIFEEIPGGSATYDNCEITTTAIDIDSFTCADIGTPVTVTVFVSDASGNIASSTAVVTIVDVMGPAIVCPEDQTVDTDPDAITYTVPDYFGEGLATVTDNCTDPVTIISQDPAPGDLLLDGTYTVTLTAEDEYGNESTCEFELIVDTILGNDDNVLADAIVMYPNPAQAYVSIKNNSQIGLTQATIYDINGKLVSQVDLSLMSGEQRIDVSGLSSGVYMVNIQSETASVVKRLIKK